MRNDRLFFQNTEITVQLFFPLYIDKYGKQQFVLYIDSNRS